MLRLGGHAPSRQSVPSQRGGGIVPRRLPPTLDGTGGGKVDDRNAGQDDRAVAVREAVIANRDTINATLRAGGGRMWCCLAALAVYPAPCPFGRPSGRRRT